jgi:hypothetical protein
VHRRAWASERRDDRPNIRHRSSVFLFRDPEVHPIGLRGVQLRRRACVAKSAQQLHRKPVLVMRALAMQAQPTAAAPLDPCVLTRAARLQLLPVGVAVLRQRRIERMPVRWLHLLKAEMQRPTPVRVRKAAELQRRQHAHSPEEVAAVLRAHAHYSGALGGFPNPPPSVLKAVPVEPQQPMMAAAVAEELLRRQPVRFVALPELDTQAFASSRPSQEHPSAGSCLHEASARCRSKALVRRRVPSRSEELLISAEARSRPARCPDEKRRR